MIKSKGNMVAAARVCSVQGHHVWFPKLKQNHTYEPSGLNHQQNEP